MTVTDERPFSARLRAATWDDHRATEATGFVTRLIGGGLPRDGYAALVAQHWFIYEVLEQAAGAMRADPVAGRFVDDRLRRLPALAADLRALLGPHWQERVVPNPATAAYRARMREVCFTWPAGFIAHHYTRYLGDLSGGQVIGAAVRERYGLGEGPGTGFYDFAGIGPAGAFKRAYRQRLDALPYDEAELARLAGEVSVAYQLNTRVLLELDRDIRPGSGGPAEDPFPPLVVVQIMRHMNEDHAADSLLIVRALGGLPEATTARMTGLDADGIDFAATVAGAERPVRVPFARRLGQRQEVRREVVRMYREATRIMAGAAAS